MQVQLHNFLMLNLFFFIKKLHLHCRQSFFIFRGNFKTPQNCQSALFFDLIKGAFSAVTLQIAGANYPLQLFANDIFAIF